MSEDTSHRFTIRGKSVTLSANDIERAVKGKGATRITMHYVEVGGVPYPVKQVVAAATDLPLIAFTTMDAYRVLEKLGFRVKQVKRP